MELFKDGEGKINFIHRLVAQAYLSNPNNYPQVNHKDENKQHNNINNLEWCDAAYNNTYGSHTEKIIASLKDNKRASKPIICVETGIIYESAMDAYRKTGIKNNTISHVLNGRHKTAGGYHWRFYE